MYLERRLVMGQQGAARVVVVVLQRWLAWLLHSYLNIAFVFFVSLTRFNQLCSLIFKLYYLNLHTDTI